MKKVMTLVTVMAFAMVLCGSAFAADVKADVVGKVEVKDKDVSIKVSDSKTADLKGKDLKVIGAKLEEVKKLAGKEVEASGTVKDGKEIDVAKVAEKKAAAAPAEKKAAAAPAAKK